MDSRCGAGLYINYIPILHPEKAVAAHSGALAWRIPGTGEPRGLPSTGPHRVGHDWTDIAAAAASRIFTCKIVLCIEGTSLAVQWLTETPLSQRRGPG